MIFRMTAVLCILPLLAACQDGSRKADQKPDAGRTSALQTVSVYQSDGSIQCGRPGIAPEIMQEQLIAAGGKVLCSQKGDSGLSVIAMCGALTTAINVYAIDAADWPKAEKLGFKRIEELSEYTGQGCKKNLLEKK